MYQRAAISLALAIVYYGVLANETISNDVILTVQTKENGNESSPLLFGVMFEEMDHSGDGGIHGQLLQNNGFQGTSLGLTAYLPVGSVNISQDSTKAVSQAITSSIRVSVFDNATDYVGFANSGYNGVPVINATYNTSFWMMGKYSGNINLKLIGSHSGIVYADHNVTVNSTPHNFTQYQTYFKSKSSPDGENEWQLTFDASKVTGSSLHFGYIELFPPTFHDRENGLRKDVAAMLDGANPAFLRFPGGNNLEGQQVDSRWKWNTTIGPLINRPGRESDWQYPNTDALGLDEYLWWCEDMKMVPVLAVWAGESFGEVIYGPDLQPFVDDIMNELEYLLGNSSTFYGKQRAQNGRQKPWKIDYVEIGNEDDLSGGCDTYPGRFNRIYKAIHETYPRMKIIASNGEPECLPSPLPEGVMIDLHLYRQPDEFVALFNQFDNYPRDHGLLIGEYGCRNTTSAFGTYWSFIQASCSEAVYMIGMERNSDIVTMAAYAPLLQHFGYDQWSPTLYGFNSTPGTLTPSTSYFVQKMFASNKGDTVIPVNSSTEFGPLYWVATKTGSQFFIKLANYGSEEQNVTISIPGTTSGRLEMLAGSQNQSNIPLNVTAKIKTTEVQDHDGVYSVFMTPWAVAALAVK